MGIAQALTTLKVELAALRFTPIIAATMINQNGQPQWSIVPGEPIRIRWRFDHGLLEKGPDLVSVRFLIEGQLVRQLDDIAATDPFAGGTGDKTETIVVGDPNIASVVYKFGAKSLEIEVRGNEAGANLTYSAKRRFFVAAESVDATWWQWRSPDFENIEWKEEYTLVGDFINKLKFAKVQSLTVELSEVRSEDNPQINPCDYLPVKTEFRNQIPAGSDVGLSFARRHDWSWLMPGTFAITGPTEKEFAYAVQFYFTDEYNNSYDGVCSSRIERLVAVSDGKMRAAATAMAAATAAVAFLATAAAMAAGIITAVGAAGFLAAAGVAYSTAAAAATVAYDPPSPDPNYREPVSIASVKPIQQPDRPATTKELEALLSLLETAAWVLALESARTLTRARLMGARVFGDDAAVELHRQGYLKIERKMAEAADKLGRLLPEAQKQAEASGFFDRDRLSAWLDALAQAGFSQPMFELMKKAGLDDSQISRLAALITHRAFIELAKAIGLAVKPLVVHLQHLVEEVRKERETVLAGETYVPAPRQPETAFEEEVYPDPEARLRPKPRCC